MTWTETHERMRIIHEVEEVSANDLSGAIPWRDEWSAYFSGPNALVAALRSRWNHMTEVQLDDRMNREEDVDANLARLRASQAGILAILRAAAFDAPRVLRLTGPAAHQERPTRSRPHFRLLRGPVLPTTNPAADR